MVLTVSVQKDEKDTMHVDQKQSALQTLRNEAAKRSFLTDAEIVLQIPEWPDGTVVQPLESTPRVPQTRIYNGGVMGLVESRVNVLMPWLMLLLAFCISTTVAQVTALAASTSKGEALLFYLVFMQPVLIAWSYHFRKEVYTWTV